jgi:hypothetical protein
MGCHTYGTIHVADLVHASVFDGRSFSKDIRDAVEALYPPPDHMDQFFGDDGRRFASAMNRAGLDPELRLSNVEPINALSTRFEGLLDTHEAAAELGITPDGFVAAVNDGNRRYRSLINRLGQYAVSRGEFEGRFAELIGDLTDQEMIQLDKPKLVPAKVIAKPAPYAPPATSYTPPATSYAPARPRPTAPAPYQQYQYR